MGERGQTAGFKYRAFISYRHRDKAWADWLHTSLEHYRVPRELVGQPGRDGPVPARIAPVFRDREELAASVDLGAEIEEALRQSAALIVICTPGAVASPYVAAEILTFKRLGRADRIFAIIAEGEPHAADPAQECFPDALKFHLDDDGALSRQPAEPIAADARDHADGRENAKLKLIAGVLGVGFDQLRRRELEAQRRRFRRFAAIAATLIIIFAGLAGAAGWFGYRAEQERARAEDNLDKARKTANAVVGDLAKEFRDAAGMQAMLGQRILARAKALMDELGAQGSMTEARLRERAEALGLLGRVSYDVGQIGQAEPALREALVTWRLMAARAPDDPQAVLETARTESSLAWVASGQGRGDEAGRLQQSALARLEAFLALPAAGADPASYAEALDLAVSLADPARTTERRTWTQRAIEVRTALVAPSGDTEERRRLAASYRTLASLAVAAGDLPAAVAADAQSLAEIKALVAADDYVARWKGDLASHLMGSAVIAFHRGDLAGTKARLDQSLAVSERLILLDPTNARYRELAASALDLVNALANLAGDATASETAQRRAIAIWQGLVDVDPRNVQAKASLAAAWSGLANFLGGAKRPDDRIAAMREAVSLREAILDAALGETATIALAEALVNLAYAIQSRTVTSDEALSLANRAAGLIQPLLQKRPQDEALTSLQAQIDVLRTMVEAQRRGAGLP